MKIGILTHHWVPNFGANLQAFSSFSYLKSLGHDVQLINYRSVDLVEHYNSMISDDQLSVHEEFCRNYLSQTKICQSTEDLKGIAHHNDFDIVIVGSDAMFRLDKKLDRSDTSFPNPFWLKWLESGDLRNICKVSLAGSAMGTFYFSYSPKIWFGIHDALKKFDYLSVRDDWTQLMFSLLSIGRHNVKICPDPMIVFEEQIDVPSSTMNQKSFSNDNYILICLYPNMVSDDWVRKFVKYAHHKDFSVFTLPNPEGPVKLPVDRIINLPLSPLNWYSWIKNAKGYLGVRFHAMLSSIVSETPFISIDTYRRRYQPRFMSKIFDLCSRGGFPSSVVPSHKLEYYSPEDIFNKLIFTEQDRIYTYRLNSIKQFHQIINNILELCQRKKTC